MSEPHHGPSYAELQAEVERLRAMKCLPCPHAEPRMLAERRLREVADAQGNYELYQQQAESRLAQIVSDYEELDLRLAQAEAEVERLTEALRLAGDVQITYRGAWDKWQQRAERVEARLREVVEAYDSDDGENEVVGDAFVEAIDKARAALAAAQPEEESRG